MSWVRDIQTRLWQSEKASWRKLVAEWGGSQGGCRTLTNLGSPRKVSQWCEECRTTQNRKDSSESALRTVLSFKMYGVSTKRGSLSEASARCQNDLSVFQCAKELGPNSTSLKSCPFLYSRPQPSSLRVLVPLPSAPPGFSSGKSCFQDDPEEWIECHIFLILG